MELNKMLWYRGVNSAVKINVLKMLHVVNSLNNIW